MEAGVPGLQNLNRLPLALACALVALPTAAQERPPTDTATAESDRASAKSDPATADSDSAQAPPPSTLGAAARYVPLAFASDMWSTLAAPFRMDGEEWLKVGGALGAAAVLAVFDEDLQHWVARHHDDDIPHAVEDIGEFVEPVALMGNTNVYYAGGMLIGWVTGTDELRHIAEELLFSHWIASITRKGIGRPIGRLRPEESPDDAFAREYWDGTSFPSGHASTAMQVAAVLAHHIDWWPADAALYGLAGTVVYQRVATEKHWSSDAVLGALWGYGVARIVIDRREADRTDFILFFDPGAGAVGMRVSTPF